LSSVYWTQFDVSLKFEKRDDERLLSSPRSRGSSHRRRWVQCSPKNKNWTCLSLMCFYYQSKRLVRNPDPTESQGVPGCELCSQTSFPVGHVPMGTTGAWCPLKSPVKPGSEINFKDDGKGQKTKLIDGSRKKVDGSMKWRITGS
jgi:hypothetical protein